MTLYTCRYSCKKNPRCGIAGSLSVCVCSFDSVSLPSVEVAPVHILASMCESLPTSSPAQCFIKLIIVSLTDEESCFCVVIDCIILFWVRCIFPYVYAAFVLSSPWTICSYLLSLILLGIWSFSYWFFRSSSYMRKSRHLPVVEIINIVPICLWLSLWWVFSRQLFNFFMFFYSILFIFIMLKTLFFKSCNTLCPHF